MCWGHRREAGEIRRGRREGLSRTGGAGEGWRAFAHSLEPREACWAPTWCALLSETRGGRHAGAPSVLLSLNSTPHTPIPPPFPALWVLSISPAHCPTLPLLTPCHPQPRSFPPFFFFSSSFFLLWFCFTFQLLFHLYFYFYFFSNIAVSFLV